MIRSAVAIWIRARGLDTPDTGMIYTHYGASPTQRINLYIKTRSDLLETANAVSAIMQRLDPLQPIDTITPLNEVKEQWLAPTRLRTGLIAAFGVHYAFSIEAPLMLAAARMAFAQIRR